SLLSAMGQGPGLRHARKHLAAYVDHAGRASSPLRNALVTAEDPNEARRLIERLFAHPEREAAA
ncbi:MAG: tRNA dihydrouridine synthase DusB, partial [Methylocystis sp.]